MKGGDLLVDIGFDQSLALGFGKHLPPDLPSIWWFNRSGISFSIWTSIRLSAPLKGSFTTYCQPFHDIIHYLNIFQSQNQTQMKKKNGGKWKIKRPNWELKLEEQSLRRPLEIMAMLMRKVFISLFVFVLALLNPLAYS